MENNYNNLKIAERGARISLAAYIVLSGFKLFMGYFFNSEALTADGFNNSTDIIASFAIVVGLKMSRKPADKDHTYGHLRAETIASLIASLIMIAVGGDVTYKGIKNAVFLKPQKPDVNAAVVSVICGILIYIMYRYNKKTADRIKSSALMAAAKDNLSDSMVSFGAAIGIFSSQFGFPWIDPLTAFFVGILICKTGIDIFRESVHNLTDGFDPKKLNDILVSIKNIKGVNKIKDVKARTHGNFILLDVIILVNPSLTVLESHKITESVEKMLRDEFHIEYIIIHVEPDVTYNS